MQAHGQNNPPSGRLASNLLRSLSQKTWFVLGCKSCLPTAGTRMCFLISVACTTIQSGEHIKSRYGEAQHELYQPICIANAAAH
jgi:hypothetical protein